MINVTLKDYGDHWTMSVTGHAGYAQPGEDIVCGAVSALWYTLLLEIEETCDHFETTGPDDAPESVTAWGCRHTMRTIMRGMRFVERSYPDYVTVTRGVPYES